jgi:hypothetical protein
VSVSTQDTKASLHKTSLLPPTILVFFHSVMLGFVLLAVLVVLQFVRQAPNHLSHISSP